MLKNETLLISGKTDKNDLYFSPTVINEPSLDSELMEGEIFGPILPLISYENEKDIDTVIYKYEKPLALYIFTSKNHFAKKIIKKYSFGGGAVNDTIVLFTNHRLPFGGVGKIGIGSYQGQQTFNTFSHKKGIVKRYNWLDIPVRYAPYKGKLNLLKTFMKWF